MKTRGILDKYIDHYKLRRVEGNGEDDVITLLPYLFMDVAYQYFRKYVSRIPAKQMMKRHLTMWRESYNSFNKGLSIVFTPDEYELVTDLMDKFEKDMEHDIFIAHIACMNCLMTDNYSREDQAILSGILMCNQLARISQAYWHDIFCRIYVMPNGAEVKEPSYNRHLDGVLHNSQQLAYQFILSRGQAELTVQEKYAKQLEDAVGALVQKTTRWAKNMIQD